MDLPFSAAVLDSVLGRYNASIWPLQVVAHGLVLLALALVLRPTANSGRAVAAVLAAAWAWVGVGFHLGPAAAIDFAAPAYGAAFVVQAVLLAWVGVVRGRLAFRVRRGAVGWVGGACLAVAVIGAPLLAALAGRSWPNLPLVATSPDPTALATIGLLLLGAGRGRLSLLAIPGLWTLVSGLTAWMLGTPERLVLPVLAVAAATAAAADAWAGRCGHTAR